MHTIVHYRFNNAHSTATYVQENPHGKPCSDQLTLQGVLQTLSTSQHTSAPPVTCFVAVLQPGLWLQWKSDHCGLGCSGKGFIHSYHKTLNESHAHEQSQIHWKYPL